MNEFIVCVLRIGGGIQLDAFRRTGRYLDDDEYREALAAEAAAVLASKAGRLANAAPDLLAALTMGGGFDTAEMLAWVADRLVQIHGDSPNEGFVLAIRERAAACKAAVAKAAPPGRRKPRT